MVVDVLIPVLQMEGIKGDDLTMVVEVLLPVLLREGIRG